MHGDGGESDNFANFEEDMIATRRSYALFIEGNTCMANCRNRNLAKLFYVEKMQLGGAEKPHVADKEEPD